jgi:hypothetical protein
VWAIYQDIESRHPRGTPMDLREIVHECGLMEKLRANHETQTLFQT